MQEFNWSQFEETPQEEFTFEGQELAPDPREQLRKQYPGMPEPLFNILLGLSEQTAKSPGASGALQKAGDVAGWLEQAGEPFAAIPPAIGMGAIKGATAPINLISQLMGKGDVIPAPSETEIMKRHPIASLIGEAAGMAGPYGLAMKGLGAIPGLGGAGFGSAMARGAGAGALVTPGDTGERGLGAAVGGALPGIGKAIGMAKTLSKKNMVRSVLEPHDAIQKSFDKRYRDINDSVKKTGIKKFKLEPELFEEIREDFPDRTRRFKKFVNEAEKGDYNDLKDLQSQMGEMSRGLRTSKKPVDRRLGKHIDSLRSDMNEQISDRLRLYGEEGIADNIDNVSQDYAKFAKMYYKDKTIAKMVGEDRVIPKNIKSKLLGDSTHLKAFRAAHPELEKAKLHAELLEKLGLAKKSAKIAAGIGGTLLGGTGLYKIGKNMSFGE